MNISKGFRVIDMFDTIRELITIYISVLVISGLLFSLFESKSFLDGLWWACITSTTVGYGDQYPVTIGGKIVGVILAHFSVMIVLPLMIGRICNTMIQDSNEFTHDEQEEIRQKLDYIISKIDKTDW